MPQQVRQDAPVLGAIEPRTIRRGFVLRLRWLTNALCLGFGDMVALALAFAASSVLRLLVAAGTLRIPLWFPVVMLVWMLVALGGGLLPGWGLGIVRELRRVFILLPVTFAGVAMTLILGGHRGGLTRLEFLVALAISLPLLPYVRTKMKSLLIRLGAWGMPTVVCGDLEAVEPVLQAIRREPGLGYAPVSVCLEGDSPSLDRVEGLPVIADLESAAASASAAIISSSSATRHYLLGSTAGPLSRYRHVLVVPDLINAPSVWVESRDLGGMLGLEIAQNLANPSARAVKRVLELLLVVLTLPLWLPLVGLLALVVRLVDGHSPFFSQQRIGLDGAPFVLHKLRTMRPGADEALRRTLEVDAAARRQWERNLKLRRDPRITPLGARLRRLSLDELPQLWNVLRGEMALVGPRPLAAEEERLVAEPARSLRESVRPGITGLWQVSGRSDTGLDGIVDRDTYYVRNWSPWLDLVIIVRTLRVIVAGTGAY